MRLHNIIHNRYFISALLLVFINITLSGCYTFREVTINNDKTIKIIKLETISGIIIDFSKTKLGYAVISDNSIIYYNSDGKQETLPVSDVKKYYTEKFDLLKTGGVFLIGTAVLLIIGALFVTHEVTPVF